MGSPDVLEFYIIEPVNTVHYLALPFPLLPFSLFHSLPFLFHCLPSLSPSPTSPPFLLIPLPLLPFPPPSLSLCHLLVYFYANVFSLFVSVAGSDYSIKSLACSGPQDRPCALFWSIRSGRGALRRLIKADGVRSARWWSHRALDWLPTEGFFLLL